MKVTSANNRRVGSHPTAPHHEDGIAWSGAQTNANNHRLWLHHREPHHQGGLAWAGDHLLIPHHCDVVDTERFEPMLNALSSRWHWMSSIEFLETGRYLYSYIPWAAQQTRTYESYQEGIYDQEPEEDPASL